MNEFVVSVLALRDAVEDAKRTLFTYALCVRRLFGNRATEGGPALWTHLYWTVVRANLLLVTLPTSSTGW